MQKKLIINSDDFGLTRGINNAIVDSFLTESISSASLMVNVPETAHAVSLIQKYHLKEIGVHVNVTFGKPVMPLDQVPSLIDETGHFRRPKWWTDHTVNETELIAEFKAQIELFKRLTNQEPMHINYHHTIDFYGAYPKLREAITTYAVPMRLESGFDGYHYPYVNSLQLFLKENKYDFFKEISGNLIELPCHIGYVDDALRSLSNLSDQRFEDYRIVNSQAFKQAYHAAGYILAAWSDLELKK